MFSISWKTFILIFDVVFSDGHIIYDSIHKGWKSFTLNTLRKREGYEFVPNYYHSPMRVYPTN